MGQGSVLEAKCVKSACVCVSLFFMVGFDPSQKGNSAVPFGILFVGPRNGTQDVTIIIQQ